ncbi:MAG: toast rack family protein [Bacillota bacterium]
MNRHAGGIVNGLLVLAIGVVLLLHNLGYLQWDLWTAVAKLWPLLLIIAGLNIIFFGRSYIGLGVVILVILVVVYGVNLGFHWDRTGFVGFGSANGPRFTEVIEKSRPLPAGAQRGTVHVVMAAGELELGGVSPALVEARLDQRNWPESLRPEFTASDTEVTIKQSSLRNAVSLGGVNRQVWSLKLTDQVPLDVTVDVGAGSNRLDLSAYKLESLRYNAGAASTTITLGDLSPRCDVAVRAGAASTVVQVPRTAGIRVTATTGIGRNNLGHLGYRREGKTYTSPNYDAAPVKININFAGGVGSFELVPR